jgi:hypothetical protein
VPFLPIQVRQYWQNLLIRSRGLSLRRVFDVWWHNSFSAHRSWQSKQWRGKTTLANRLVAATPGAVAVHTELRGVDGRLVTAQRAWGGRS